MLDANSRFNIDEYGPGVHKNIKLAAQQFKDFLEEHELCASFSIQEYTSACSNTWVSTAGEYHTTDYVCFKNSLADSLTSAASLFDVDNGNLADYHWPSSAEFKFVQGSGQARAGGHWKLTEAYRS